MFVRRSSFFQHGFLHNESWPSLIFLDLVADRELIMIGVFNEPSVVLWIPLKQTLCPRPTRPCVQGIGQRARPPTALAERIDMARRDLRSANFCGRVHCSNSCRLHSDNASERTCGVRAVHLPSWIEYGAWAPLIDNVAPAPAVTIGVPAKKTMSLRDIAKRILFRAARHAATKF